MDVVMNDELTKEVSAAGNKLLGRSIFSVLAPAGNHVQIVVQQIPDHHRNVCRVVLPITVNNLNVRFDAAGSGGDTWDFKDMKARLAIVDANAPRPIGVFVTDGPYRRGNTVAVSIAFNEIVVPTPSSGFYLNTSWGRLGYESGSSGGNVLTFSGKIQDSIANGTSLSINGFTSLTAL